MFSYVQGWRVCCVQCYGVGVLNLCDHLCIDQLSAFWANSVHKSSESQSHSISCILSLPVSSSGLCYAFKLKPMLRCILSHCLLLVCLIVLMSVGCTAYCQMHFRVMTATRLSYGVATTLNIYILIQSSKSFRPCLLLVRWSFCRVLWNLTALLSLLYATLNFGQLEPESSSYCVHVCKCVRCSYQLLPHSVTKIPSSSV